MPPTANGPRRVLIVGTSDDPRVIALARGLPEDGLLMCLEPDREAAARATAAFAAAGVASHAHVIPGDPALFLRKVAGPFDLVLVTDTYASRLAAPLGGKLAPGGSLKDL